MDALLAVLILLAAAGAYMLGGGSSAPEDEALPSDPAGRRARARRAIASQDLAGIPADWLYFQAQLETGDFNSSSYYLSRSLFNRHVGSKRGDWNGQVCMDGVIYEDDAAALVVDPKTAREHLRCYDSPEQSVRDIVLLYQDPLYAAALAAAHGGDRGAFFEAVARGNGKTGFVGDPNAAKAAAYVAGLKATAARGVV